MVHAASPSDVTLQSPTWRSSLGRGLVLREPFACVGLRVGDGREDPHPHVRSRPCRTENLGYALPSTCLAGSPLAILPWLTLGWAMGSVPFR